jgi:histidinol-phosphate aminotransferase
VPNSHSGTAYPAGELAALARPLADAGRVLVVDEAYADFADDSAVRLVTEHDNLVVLRTLSLASATLRP